MPTPHSYRYFKPGDRFFLVFLAFLSAFPPITTDMYLPALPAMAKALNASDELVSYTISAFLLVFAVSMLFWGPLSYKYGRRPLVGIGASIFTIASVGAACADSIEALIFWRCTQAIGSAAACSMALAIVKDIYHGKLMEKVVSLMQACTIIAPMAAPVLGGLFLTFTDWRGVFWCLAACGLLALIGLFFTQETRPSQAASVSLLHTFTRMGELLRNLRFLYPLLIFSAMAMPFMSYLAVSAFIYQDEFHQTAQTFSIFFAVNATSSLAGPFLHLKWLRHHNRYHVLALHISLIICAGVLLLLFGRTNPYIFAMLFIPITVCGSAIRPPSTVYMMQIVPGDASTMSALINCGGLLFGSLSMFLASSQLWPSPIVAVGCISTLVPFLCLIGWMRLAHQETGTMKKL